MNLALAFQERLLATLKDRSGVPNWDSLVSSVIQPRLVGPIHLLQVKSICSPSSVCGTGTP